MKNKPGEMEQEIRSETKENALDAAERLLMRGGWTAMSMESIAKEVGIRKPSLYYYFQNGKDEIFLAVLERRAAIDGQQLNKIIEYGEDALVRLSAIGDYFSSLADRRPYRVLRDAIANLPAPARDQADHLLRSRVFDPICRVMHDGMRQGQIRSGDPQMAAGLFVTMLSALGDLGPSHASETAPAVARYIVDIFIRGVGVQAS